ncbi:hypothetical protein LCGC14_0318270 [marine sediment metagenome]|uniref:Uncharacterized protein n=1 Tax=marine sediment metagenome TaxID=412755 RepID=A0A0F9WS12_9ZZZZ
MNIGRIIFAFTRGQYIVEVTSGMVFAYPPCPRCLIDYALVNFDEKFRDGNYMCDKCGSLIRLKEKG